MLKSGIDIGIGDRQVREVDALPHHDIGDLPLNTSLVGKQDRGRHTVLLRKGDVKLSQ